MRRRIDTAPNGKPLRSAASCRSRRPVMISGGAGFIGTNLATQLIENGRDVLLFDNLSRPGVEENLAWLTDQYGEHVKVEVQDIRDSLAVRHAVARSSAVFHLAAQVAVTHSLVDPGFDFEVNARGTLNVLEACRGCTTPPPLLFTSTNKVYGSLADVRCVRDGDCYQPSCAETRAHGVSEARPLQFHSPYGCSKGAADQYVLDYARCYSLPAVVFRMSCIYGPHQCGNEDQGWLAHFARRIIADEPLSIYGDGRQVRDVLFVTDLVAAMLKAIDQIKVTAGQAFNIGGGPANAVSLLQVIDHLAELRGQRPEVEYGPWRQGDQKYYVSDTRRFQATTGWAPAVDAPQGIERLWAWLAEHVVEQPALSGV
ncbi:NAD-dependent epimerase/dehydratase family protein [Candidatus Laterigemmans baculatus]|uniref:NAD-dependent epimerase/dehydratase family protein n=1 Tax=Candidatus Laterigemmans baculatus TaxID=2770505 RepID=UPI0013DC7C6A|nr:NAD-dependent epimerase/dehydratase family protein [Candidatus Laterigemmans baculatus]